MQELGARAQPAAEVRQRTGKTRFAGGLADRRALEQQPHRQISAKRDVEIARGHAVGPLFNLSNDARPASQRQ